jgi:hypothetical protein
VVEAAPVVEAAVVEPVLVEEVAPLIKLAADVAEDTLAAVMINKDPEAQKAVASLVERINRDSKPHESLVGLVGQIGAELRTNPEYMLPTRESILKAIYTGVNSEPLTVKLGDVLAAHQQRVKPHHKKGVHTKGRR